MRLLPCGDRAVLVELPDRPTRVALAADLHDRPPAGLADVVEGALTLLVRTTDEEALRAVVARLRDGTPDRPEAPPPPAEDALVVPVTYDGPDVADLSHRLGESTTALVARHTATEWVVDFTGFLPGFGYLRPVEETVWPHVPRRATPRTRVPAGSVAAAAGWTGVYPSVSPGGWQLLGRTALATWDQHAAEPALLVPGRRVRFVVAS